MRGKRWKLAACSLKATRAFPSNGRVVVRHGTVSAENVLDLPAAQTRSKDDLSAIPAGMWLTIGLLAQDGLAMQVRLKRSAEPSDRDKAEGTWHVYHAVGGALTLLDSIEKPEGGKCLEKVQSVESTPGVSSLGLPKEAATAAQLKPELGSIRSEPVAASVLGKRGSKGMVAQPEIKQGASGHERPALEPISQPATASPAKTTSVYDMD